MQTVYLETTIPSYLAAHPSRQRAIAVDQEATRHWWENERGRFRLFTSAFTFDECSRGDESAAERRLSYLAGIPESLWALFGTGYLGYTAARQWGKVRGVER